MPKLSETPVFHHCEVNKDIEALTLLRLYQVIGSHKRGIPAILPIGRTTFLNRVKSGEYPSPVVLGKRSVAWRASEIMTLLERFSSKEKKGAL